jgi:hypothetical protein
MSSLVNPRTSKKRKRELSGNSKKTGNSRNSKNSKNNKKTGNSKNSKRTRKKTRFYTPEVPKKKPQILKKKESTYTKESFEMMMYSIAAEFVSNKTFANKLKYIHKLLFDELGSKLRAVITGGDADSECKKARKRGKSPAQHYKSSIERDKGISAVTVEETIKLTTLIKDGNGKQIKIQFNAEKKGYCGDCWMCGLAVSYYSGNGFVTSCGECEHIGAITASFLTGMLTSANLDIQSYNYGSSHVHCNRKKSDNISMEFNDGQWKQSKQGIKIIVDKIIDINDSKLNGSEYDPVFREEFLNKLKKKSDFSHEITTNIEGVTDEWCKIANDSISSVPKDKKISAYNLTEQIKAVTIELMKKTKNFQKFNGGVSIDNKRPRVTNSNDAMMNVDSPNNDIKQQPAIVTPNSQQTTDNEIEKNFKQAYGKVAVDLLYKLHESHIKEEVFFENVEKARIKTLRFKELNEELDNFNKALYKSSE